MFSSFTHPALILIAGAFLLPFIRGPLRRPYLFLVPLLAMGAVVANSALPGEHGLVQFLDWQLVFGRVDRLSTIFARASRTDVLLTPSWTASSWSFILSPGFQYPLTIPSRIAS